MSGGEIEKGHKIKGFSVISGGDATAVLQPAKGALHDIALFVDAA
jgi:hypothetical protein